LQFIFLLITQVFNATLSVPLTNGILSGDVGTINGTAVNMTSVPFVVGNGAFMGDAFHQGSLTSTAWNIDTLTVSFWVNQSNLGAEGFILEHGEDVDANRPWEILALGNITWRQTTGAGESSLVANGNISFNQSHHGWCDGQFCIFG